MINAQSIAVRIEQKLRAKGYAKMGDADLIRADPMAFMDTVLKHYEAISEENDKKAADFWEVYEQYKGYRLDDFGEDAAQEFATDIANLFV